MILWLWLTGYENMENTLQNTSANSYGQNIDSGANQSQQPSIMPKDMAKLARG